MYLNTSIPWICKYHSETVNAGTYQLSVTLRDKLSVRNGKLLTLIVREMIRVRGKLLTLISSPGPKVQVNYCHHLASVVCKLFTFQASSPKPLGRLEPNLAGMFLGWSSTKLLFFVPVGYSICNLVHPIFLV